MKTSLTASLSLVGLLSAFPAPAQTAASGRPGASWTSRQFQEVDTLFANPGQGWMSQARAPKAEPRFPCSVVYIRFNWADIEPEQGQYNWQVIDDVIAAWKPRGTAVAFRVMTCNAHSDGYYASPKWLFDAGCKGFEYLRGGDDPTSGGKRVPRVEPDYANPIYLARHGEFLAALGRRYDGSPAVEFLDIGSYGIWGEWHTPHPASAVVRKQILDFYLQAFRRTPMVFMSDDAEVLNYALASGTGFRRDGVGSPWHEQNWIGSKKYAEVQGMAETWQRAPVVFEWFGNYDYLRSKAWSFDAAVNFMLNNHVTLINDNVGRVPPEAMPQLEWRPEEYAVETVPHPMGPGNAVVLAIEGEHVTEVFTGFGERGRPAEEVARSAAEAMKEWLEANVPADEHLADQLLIPMVLAGGGSFRTTKPSLHTTTNVEVIQRFLPVPIHVEQESELAWGVKVGSD